MVLEAPVVAALTTALASEVDITRHDPSRLSRSMTAREPPPLARGLGSGSRAPWRFSGGKAERGESLNAGFAAGFIGDVGEDGMEMDPNEMPVGLASVEEGSDTRSHEECP